MRILGHIDHPHLKITVFGMGNRISVKFENENYEQTFKLGQDERISNFGAVMKWVDSELVESVLTGMELMHRSRLAANSRAFPEKRLSEFEEII